MSIALSKRVAAIKPSATLTIAAKATQLKAEGIDIIGLNVGEPDYDTPLSIKAVGIDAIHEGLTKYTAVGGTASLKAAIVRKFERDNQLEYRTDEVMAGNGAKQVIMNAMLATLNPQDEVIIPAPYWASYPDMCKLAEAEPVIVQTHVQTHFKMTAEQLESAITPKTKMLILNSPGNPTGMVYSKTELRALANVLLNYPNIIIISDDIYESIIWSENTFYNIVNVAPQLKEQTLVVNGISKTFAMTGWRIGYGAGPANLIKAMTKIQSQTTSSPCSISQSAAAEALVTEKSIVSEMVETYQGRYQFIHQALESIHGIDLYDSQGTFYIFPHVGKLIKRLGLKNDIELTEFLLDKAHVSVVPGSAFGCNDHIRISFAICKKNLQTAIERIQEAIV